MVDNAVILYRAWSDGAVLSGGSYQLPLTNAQDPDIGIVARSTNAAAASTKFVADLGVATAVVGGIVLGPINSSPASSYRIRGYSNAALTVQVYDSGTKAVAGSSIDWASTLNWLEWEDPGFWLGDNSSDVADGTPLYLIEIPPADVTAQYWLVELFDTANADGYVEFGRLLIARAYRLTHNYSEDDNRLGFNFATDKQDTLGLLTNYWERGLQRTWRMTLPVVDDAELFGTVFDVAIRSGISRQVFIVPEPADTTNYRKRCFLATFQEAPSIAQREIDIGSTAFDFIEVT